MPRPGWRHVLAVASAGLAAVLAAVVIWWISGRSSTPPGPIEVQWRWPLWDTINVMRAYPRPGPAMGLEARPETSHVALPGMLLTRTIIASSDASGRRTVVYVQTAVSRR